MARIYKHKCKECETDFYVEDNKLVAIARCPKCTGDSLYIDEYQIGQDKQSKDMFDSFKYAMNYLERLKGVKDMPEGNPRTTIPEPIKPLLSIELQDESSVPKVFYKGKEIKYKRNVYFDWDTDTDEYGGLSYAIEHAELGNKLPVINRIERQVKGHAT